MFQIYLITNKLNGKYYVGKTSKTLEERWYAHVKDSNRFQHHFANAIRFHGPQSFRIQSIQFCDTEEQANELEKFWIQKLQSMAGEFGYNSTYGGEGISICPPELFERRYKAQIAAINAPNAKRSSTRFGYGRTSPQLRTDISTEVLVEKYLQGNSPRAIGKMIGWSGNGVLRRLRKSGISIRSRKDVVLGRPRHG